MSTGRRIVRTLLTGAAVAVGYVVVRQRTMRWGTTQSERCVALPGDELLPVADMVATRAITVNAPESAVWPWLVQLGQGRGGFYSYDALENLVGLDIHSADHIDPAWQELAEGEPVHLAEGFGLTVARLQPHYALVLHGDGPSLPDEEDEPPFDFVWSFVLRPGQQPGTTRLVVRERYAYTQSWAKYMVEGVQLVSFVMTEKMLRGIRDRAERVA